MLFKLFLLFVIVPLVELVLLMILADTTHWTYSVLLVISTGALGAWLAKGQGIAALRRVRESMTNSQMPTAPLLDAALIFFAGGLLLTPGILTDILGISIMIPRCRDWYRERLIAWFKKSFSIQVVSSFKDPNVVDSYVVDPDDDRAGASQSGASQHAGLVEDSNHEGQ